MAWLGEELPETRAGRPHAGRRAASRTSSRSGCSRAGATCSASCRWCSWTPPRCTSRAGAARRSAQRGHSKDHRPHLNQMVIGVIIDQHGRPVCSEMWPGNTTDVTTLLPVIDRLRERFAIGRICVVADRGMISDAARSPPWSSAASNTFSACASATPRRSARSSSPTRAECAAGHPARSAPDTELEAKEVWRRRPPLRGLPQPRRGQARCRGARGGAAQSARDACAAATSRWSATAAIGAT